MNQLKKRIRTVPIPISGVALGYLAFGNIIKDICPAVRSICGAIALILLLCLLIKCICFPEMICAELKLPIILSVSGTFPMALELFSTYVVPYSSELALALWSFGIVLHLALMITFTCRCVLRCKIQNIIGSWFIVYVGIVAGSVSAPAHGFQNIGRTLWYPGITGFVILFVPVLFRYIKIPETLGIQTPLFCIIAAPASLCLVGYMQCFEKKSAAVVAGLIIISYLLYVPALLHCIKNLNIRFYPSVAAFTFPFVISANASKMAYKYFETIIVFKWILYVQIVLAAVLLCYASVRYFDFLLGKNKMEEETT